MNEKIKNNIARLSGAGLILAVVIAAPLFGARTAAGIIVGGAWNLASLWCLTRMLQAWIGPQPSQRRAIIWLLMKFPLLYAAIFFIFQTKIVSFSSFSVGFTLVLLITLACFMVGLRKDMKAAKS